MIQSSAIRGIVFVLVSCRMAFGQLSAVPAVPLPAFEVASIRPHGGSLHVIRGFSSSGSRLMLEGYTRRDLVLEAYGLKDYQLSWTPKAVAQDEVYYDIIAKAEDGAPTSRADFRRMLQVLLTRRFDLKIHPETRVLPVYALVVGKNGPKLKLSAPDAPETGFFGVHGRNQTIEMPRESMQAFADQLPGIFFVNRPVLDRTGLTGTYDIKFEATPEVRTTGNPEQENISIFTAVQDQLGLKLEPARAEMPILVVDHIDGPSEN